MKKYAKVRSLKSFSLSMLFDEEIKNEIIYNENQEEDNSFDMKSKEVVPVFTELVRKVKYQISKLKNKNLTRKRQRNQDNWDRKKRKKSLK